MLFRIGMQVIRKRMKASVCQRRLCYFLKKDKKPEKNS